MFVAQKKAGAVFVDITAVDDTLYSTAVLRTKLLRLVSLYAIAASLLSLALAQKGYDA